MNERIILGIDPGTNIMGYGIISVKANKISLVATDVINMSKMDDSFEKMKLVFRTIYALIETHSVDEVAIEAPFFGKNVQSMLKLGRAQGVAMAAALYKNIPIFEYSPKRIKQSITGNGNASKEQVAAMLQSLLVIKDMPKHLDATDGLAAAVCHYFQRTNKQKEKNYSGWKAFLSDHPKKIV